MSGLDLWTIALYAVLVLGIGWFAGRGHQRSADLHLAGRDLPGAAIAASMLATELSAATFIGVPQAAYFGDWSYLQFAFGALAGKLVVAGWVIPAYYRSQNVTVYGFLGERLGPVSRRAAALAFIAGRILASGVRLFIAALAFSVATGFDLSSAILLSGAVSGTYTLFGGIRSVVWTDTLQAFVFLLGAAALLYVLSATTPGDLEAFSRWSGEGDRLRVFHLEPLFSLTSSQTFGVGIVGGFFLTLATHATDHDMVQRLLCARSARSGSASLIASALLNFPITLLFLAVGSGIAFHHALAPPAWLSEDSARILPLYALHAMPAPLRGLVFAGLFAAAMSSLDSAICALGTTFSVDVLRETPHEAQRVRRARWSTVAFSFAIMGAAMTMALYHQALNTPGSAAPVSLIEFALSAMTVLYGGLLGLFASAFLPGRRHDHAAVAALCVGAVLGAALFLQPLWVRGPTLAWPFWIPLSASVTAGVAWLLSRLSSHQSPPRLETSD